MRRHPTVSGRTGIAAGAAAGAAASIPFLAPSLFPLAWFGFAPWLAAVAQSPPGRAAASGLVAGLVGYAIALYWLFGTLAAFGEVPLGIAAVAFGLVILFHAAQIALFAAALARVGPGPAALAAPVLWTAIEHVYPMLYPWRYAYTQTGLLPLVQIADITGPAGLSFLLIWANAALSALWGRRARPLTRALPLVLVAGATVGALVYGHARIAAVDRAIEVAPSVRVALIQGNISIEEKKRPERREANREVYRRLSRTAPESDVLIWPETTVHIYLRPGEQAVNAQNHPLPDTTRPVIFGAVVHDTEGGRHRRFNSALVVMPDGTVPARYDKTVLVPFGEYTPLRERFPALAQINRGGSEYVAGTRLLALPVGGVLFAPLICYEDILPAFVRRAVRESRADVLLNVTNDGWFGESAAPLQHHRLAIWRAVEHRRPLVRATNTGLTATVDPAGRTFARAHPFVPTILTAEVHVPALPDTLYTHMGDLFAWLTAVGALALLLVRVRTGRGGRDGLPRGTAARAGRPC